jgi:hypothetical protein
VGRSYSLVRVEIEDADQVQGLWLPFHEYPPWPGELGRQPRSGPLPREVQLGDGRRIELVYSRWRDPLPAPMVLDRFVRESHPGGDQVRDFISLVRFEEGDRWSDILEVKSNHPATRGALSFYQSGWDPDYQAYTILGVGNRRGIWAMLGGVCLSIAGMIFAFYIKPAVIRRQSERLRAASRREDEEAWPDGRAETLTEREPVGATHG